MRAVLVRFMLSRYSLFADETASAFLSCQPFRHPGNSRLDPQPQRTTHASEGLARGEGRCGARRDATQGQQANEVGNERHQEGARTRQHALSVISSTLSIISSIHSS